MSWFKENRFFCRDKLLAREISGAIQQGSHNFLNYTRPLLFIVDLKFQT